MTAGYNLSTLHGSLKCLRVEVPREGKAPLMATFGGIPLRRKKTAKLDDSNVIIPGGRRKDIIKRLLATEYLQTLKLAGQAAWE